MIDFIVLNYELVLSTYVIDELRDVVGRKFEKKALELDDFLTTLSFTPAYSPQYSQPGLFEIRDDCDYPVLYTAMIEAIDVFITGDKDFDGVEV